MPRICWWSSRLSKDGNTPVRLRPDSEQLTGVLALLNEAFAYMEGRIDPPSSMQHLNVEALREQCRSGEVWVIGAEPLACVFLVAKPGHLYLGKLAVAAQARGRGFARQLVDLAMQRARDLGLPALELNTRVELAENHAVFQRMGFEVVGEESHTGFTRATSLRLRKQV